MDRATAVATWRDVCGSDTVMASGIVTGRMLEDFATRIAEAERKRWLKRHEPLLQAVEWILEDGHMNQEHLARLRAAWEWV